jgi:predicted nuclease with TOPRIM domain
MPVDSRTKTKESNAASSRAGSNSERQESEDLSTDQEALREDVEELRKSLDAIRAKHDEELNALKKELQETQSGKEHAENQHRNLLSQVNTIKSKLGERLKADAVSHALVVIMCSMLIMQTGRTVVGQGTIAGGGRSKPDIEGQ